MIYLVSGLPGAGKTLRSIWQAYKWTESDPERPIFSNIESWSYAEPIPGQWMDVPDGAIVVIDEIQQRWRRQNGASKLPREVEELETHRHRGIDFILTAQNPGQIMADVRYLIERHEHLTRRGKMQGALVSRWENHCSIYPRQDADGKDCEQEVWKFPRYLFEHYKSASQFYEQKRIPRALKVSVAMVPVGIAVVVLAFKGVAGQFLGYAEEPVPEVENGQSEEALNNDTELVGQVKAVKGVYVGGTCRLWDADGTVLQTSWTECVETVRSGLPAVLAVNDPSS